MVSPDFSGIRIDHLTRYFWAANLLAGKKVADCGCGVGYGSKILGLAGCRVDAFDISREAIEYAELHYAQKNVIYFKRSLLEDLGEHEAATAFEIIEHLKNPREFLKNLKVKTLLASVPNEDIVPWTPRKKFHFRHYRPDEFKNLLEDSGFKVVDVFGQMNEYSGVTKCIGRNIVVICEHLDCA